VGENVNIAGDITFYARWAAAVTTLTIEKTVKGDYADKTREFDYILWFENDSGEPLPALTQFKCTGGNIANGTLTLAEGGKATFTLKHGQSITIEGVAANGWAGILENPVPGYSASFTDSEGGGSEPGANTEMRPMTENARIFSFLNTRDEVPLTGADAGHIKSILFLPIFAVLMGLASLTVKAAYRRRRAVVRRGRR